MPDEICDDIVGIPPENLLEVAAAPASMQSDNQAYSEHNLKDLIEVDKYIRARKAACKGNAGWGGMSIAKVIPPGST